MVSLAHLWLPILLSAVFVFVASSLVHMVFKWHNSDYHGFSNEDEVRAAIAKGSPAPGQYTLPYCKDQKDMGSEATLAKLKEGPVGFIILRGPCAKGMNMGPMLFQWFLFCALVGLFTALILAHALAPGAGYKPVFHIAAIAAFMAYAFGSIPMGIWWGQPWRSVAKNLLDGLIYACLTAGTFGWLWPR
ncbi:MAG TPA: hypothetical protein VFF76_02740 [Holophagaceae bacterium]|jgi:hypothetical protein|nr:hypothetical protein [Holophagaceae bacterium]